MNMFPDFHSCNSSIPFIVIGIDPGSHRLGYSVIFFDTLKFILLKIGFFSFTGELGDKLLSFYDFFFSLYDALFLQYNCFIFFSIESQFVLKNFRSSFVLVSFNSVLLLIARMKSSLLFEFSPAEVRRFICADTQASKAVVQQFLSDFFSLSFSCFDESDSLAISFAGALRFLRST